MPTCPRFTTFASVLCALTVTQLAAASTADAVPNDTVAQAAPLEVGKPVQGTNVGALTEAGDSTIVCPSPNPGAFNQVKGLFAHRYTVWWRFHRKRPYYTFVSTFGSSFDTTLVVYRRVPGGPLEVVGCDYNFHDALHSTVYLAPQRGWPLHWPGRATPDPPGTEYYAQVGGCIIPTKLVACGPRVGTIRLGAYDGLPTKLGYRYFITCKHVRLTSLRLTKLPPNARIVATVRKDIGLAKPYKKRTKSRRVRGRTYDARRLIGVVRLRRDLDELFLRVESAGRITKVFSFIPQGRGEAPLADSGCLPPGETIAGVIDWDCGYPLTRFRDPPRLKCRRGSSAQARARRFSTQAVAQSTTIVNPTRIK